MILLLYSFIITPKELKYVYLMSTAIRWTIVNIPGVTLLKETNSSSPRSHKLSAAPPLAVGACESLETHTLMLTDVIRAGLMHTNSTAVSSKVQPTCHD